MQDSPSFPLLIVENGVKRTSKEPKTPGPAQSLMAVFVTLLLTVSTAIGGESDATGQPDGHAFYVAAGGDVWLGDVGGGHGYALVHWRWRGLPGPGRLEAVLNTDTLRLGVSGVPLGGPVSLFADLKGQYPYAELLPDYYHRGVEVPGRGFNAGYLLARAGLEWAAPGDDGGAHFTKIWVNGRRRFFAPAGATAEALELPEDFWSLEPRVSYTFWALEPDRSQWQPHHPFWRVRGFAAGIRMGAEFRSTTDPWGARGDAFDPPDPRNTPDTPIWTARQWARLGVPTRGPIYLALSQSFGWGDGEDDITRAQIGGLNPWVAPVAGLPWGVHKSGRYLTARAALRWATGGLTASADHEFGAFVDAGTVADPRRIGDLDDFGPVGGAGLLADLRWGGWKADARAGWAYPFAWLADTPEMSFWLSAGRVF